MTKNGVIRELASCQLCDVARLCVVYHNQSPSLVYSFAYDRTCSSSLSARQELARVLLSIYKLRRFVTDIHAVYSVRNSDGDVLYRDVCFRSDNCLQYVYSVSDFIKFVKPINK